MGQTSESLDLNLRGAFPPAGLPSPSSLTRCHLSQSERPWQSVKFPVYTLRPAAARGAVRRCAQTSRLCQGLPLWGSWTPLGGLRGRGCGQEAAHLVWHCLAEAQLYPKHDLNLGSAPLLPALPSPSSLRDATSPKVRGFGYTGKFAFSKKLPLWGSWQSRQALTERASPPAGTLRLCLAQRSVRQRVQPPPLPH